MGMNYSIRYVICTEEKNDFWKVYVEEQGLEMWEPKQFSLAFSIDSEIEQYLKKDYELFEIEPAYTMDGRVLIGYFYIDEVEVDDYLVICFTAACDDMSLLVEKSEEIKKWILKIAQKANVRCAYIDKEDWEPLEMIYGELAFLESLNLYF